MAVALEKTGWPRGPSDRELMVGELVACRRLIQVAFVQILSALDNEQLEVRDAELDMQNSSGRIRIGVGSSAATQTVQLYRKPKWREDKGDICLQASEILLFADAESLRRSVRDLVESLSIMLCR